MSALCWPIRFRRPSRRSRDDSAIPAAERGSAPPGAASDADGLRLKPRHVELLRQLNWLDFELYDYCAERRPN